MILDDAYRELEEAVGAEYVSREPAVLDSYAYQPFHKTDPGSWIHRPAAVILPGSAEEVQRVVRICNKHTISYKAHSTGWGAHSGPGKDGVLQIDLRRMDRILEIDEENMYVVVEPYAISAQVQAELMKLGLNLHIIGAGSNTSPLAACTSHMGMGQSGISMGYSGRNVLGVEWVLPDGELLRLGSLGSEAGWICGDGPGPSLRGLMRGWAGYDGGFGVFTRIAIKAYNWPGPKEPEIDGIYLDVRTKIPYNFKTYMFFFPSYECWADAFYKIGEAEIGYIMAKNPIGGFLWTSTPNLMKKIVGYPLIMALMKDFQHFCQIVLAANSRGDLTYQEKTLERIIEETEGVLIDLSDIPSMESYIWWAFIRTTVHQLSFRPGGEFFIGFGSDAAIDNAMLQGKVGEKIKQDFIDRGLVYKDNADLSWSVAIEHGLYGHLEEALFIDRRKPQYADTKQEFANDCTRATIENHLGGIGFALFGGRETTEMFNREMNNFWDWERKIKDTWDPDDLSNQTFR